MGKMIKLSIFTCVVRKSNDSDRPIVFFIDEYDTLNCWAPYEGHSKAHSEFYSQGTHPVSKEYAEEVFLQYQGNYPDEADCHTVLAEQLKEVQEIEFDPVKAVSLAQEVWDLCYTLAEKEGCGELMDLHKKADILLGLGNYSEEELD